MHISKHQLFCLVVLFEIGSSTLFAMGIDAKQDAWIAILCAMFISVGIIWCYTELQKYFPDKNLIEIIIDLLGKYIGAPLCFLYGLFFIYSSIRNLKDFSILMGMTFLPNTPENIINFIFISVAVYYVFLGLEPVARSGEIMLPLVMFFLISTFVLAVISAKVDLSELQPVSNVDMQSILPAIHPFLTNFPFCESLVFFMYWKYVNSKDIRKTMFVSIILSGMMIALATCTMICVLGVNYASISSIPLLGVIKIINVGDILSNLDAVGITIMVIGGFYKMTIFFFGGVMSFSTLFGSKYKKWIVFICAIFELWIAYTFEPNYSYHIWLGHKISLPYIHNTFQIIIPLLLLIIGWLKLRAIKNVK